jgi:hypothetical protein
MHQHSILAHLHQLPMPLSLRVHWLPPILLEQSLWLQMQPPSQYLNLLPKHSLLQQGWLLESLLTIPCRLWFVQLLPALQRQKHPWTM